MFIALSAVLALAVIALAIAWTRTRRSLETSVAVAEERSEQLELAREALREAEAEGAARSRERDDALARELRVKRDAAEVAKRLEAAARERDQLTTTQAELVAERDALAEECERLQTRPTSDDAASMDGELVWALTLARIDRLWQVSVSSGIGAASPLIGSSSLLADALEILVAAAREEAGATVELTYTGDGEVEGSTAATVVCLCEELVAAAIEGADETRAEIEVTDDDVIVSVSATRDGRDVAVPGPTALLIDGRYRVPRVRC